MSVVVAAGVVTKQDESGVESASGDGGLVETVSGSSIFLDCTTFYNLFVAGSNVVIAV